MNQKPRTRSEGKVDWSKDRSIQLTSRNSCKLQVIKSGTPRKQIEQVEALGQNSKSSHLENHADQSPSKNEEVNASESGNDSQLDSQTTPLSPDLLMESVSESPRKISTGSILTLDESYPEEINEDENQDVPTQITKSSTSKESKSQNSTETENNEFITIETQDTTDQADTFTQSHLTIPEEMGQQINLVIDPDDKRTIPNDPDASEFRKSLREKAIRDFLHPCTAAGDNNTFSFKSQSQQSTKYIIDTTKVNIPSSKKEEEIQTFQIN